MTTPEALMTWEKKPEPTAEDESVPCRDHDVEIRRMIRSSNAIESLHARCRRAINARSDLPTEQGWSACSGVRCGTGRDA